MERRSHRPPLMPAEVPETMLITHPGKTEGSITSRGTATDTVDQNLGTPSQLLDVPDPHVLGHP